MGSRKERSRNSYLPATQRVASRADWSIENRDGPDNEAAAALAESFLNPDFPAETTD